MDFTALFDLSWILVINLLICSVDFADSSANFRISSATTAKPRPCSPERAASMLAFNARRFVCSDICSTVSRITPIYSWIES
jgi:hypothetical protein